jgi:1-acyl-sn-glycerol-3-phosphate acyltransferase
VPVATTSELPPPLVDLCREDLLRAFHLPANPVTRAVAAVPSARFARFVQRFDALVEEEGLVAAGEFILRQFTDRVEVSGAKRLPRTGPLIVASNHPGMTDAMALWTTIAREDLRVIAAQRDLLAHLENIRRHLIVIEPGSSRAARQAIAHLKSGGSLLTFPAGKIEPDLAVRPGARESLLTWSPSVAHFACAVPGTCLVPALVQGVISPRAARAWPLRYLREQREREWAAATLQILIPAYRRVSVRVRYGRPVPADFEALTAAMEELIDQDGSG